ncbi:ABC transporter ATP-binding protein [Alkalilimnicola sp. S0819]|uniref:ABC transporter ATP-binding protein n=1 Tax=Alkalilimnicola sp. S0819 TaxID=2613922 RepID=UPI001261DA79|nr:ABC transporter ATP-binding protein [Alkalilimnicola sp. S0819]KAB7623385.1 ABC transporter ATP-binding protein [Alkalilimnicola sp. S0819]MPQ16927.1 ATP-binding cassette domain-containing protein [Alkalilimnicola sp. S0819]
MSDDVISTRGLHVEIGGRTICRDLALNMERTQCWGILGRNGAGKSTLLHTLAGLRPASAGEIRLLDRPRDDWSRRQRAQRLGLLPQDSEDAFPATVLETVLVGRHPHLGALAWEQPEDLAVAHQALADVGLADFAQRSVNTLSGGERRRLGLATLLTQNPRAWLLDEPTNHLDLQHQIQILELLQQRIWRDDGLIVMTLHDINLAARFCDHILLLFDDGSHMASIAHEALRPEYLERVYGHPIRVISGYNGRAYLPA